VHGRVIELNKQNNIMKKSLITGSIMLFALFAFSQNGYNPPGNVRNSFHKQFPQSQPSQWHHSGTVWSVQFDDIDHNDGEATARFDQSGRHLDTHVVYDNNDVPSPVVTNLNKRYPGSDDYQYTRINRHGQHDVYQVHMRHHSKYKTVYVDRYGHQMEYHERNY
jgi:hypothetical protein